MDELKPMDAEQLRECGHQMVDFIADYYKNIESFPVRSQVQVLVPYALELEYTSFKIVWLIFHVEVPQCCQF